jgi:hypothetical protein
MMTLPSPMAFRQMLRRTSAHTGQRVLALCFGLLMAPPMCAVAQHAPSDAQRTVVVNDVRIHPQMVRTLEQGYRVRILAGRYWYDRVSGAWGFEGGPTAGFILPELDLGGPLRADASRGATDVFVNGRQLPMADVRALQPIVGPVQPGRYWLDAYGNVGYEGGPPILNLAVMARRAGVGANNTFYRSSATDIGAGSSGGTSYVMGEGWSVTIEH